MGFFMVLDKSIILIISTGCNPPLFFFFFGYITAVGEFGFEFQALQVSYRPTHY